MRQTKGGFFERYYHTITGSTLNIPAKKFLRNLSFSLGGGLIAFAILFVLNIIAARLLGPEEYGKYSLIVAVANIFAIVCVLDLDVSITRFSAKENLLKNKQRAITTGTFFVWGLIVVFLGLVYECRELIQSVFSFSQTMLYLAVLLGVIISLKRLYESVLRGLDLFFWYALGRIGESVVIGTAFLGIFFGNYLDGFSSYTYAVIIGGFVAIVLYSIISRNFFNTRVLSFSSIQIKVLSPRLPHLQPTSISFSFFYF